MTFLRDDLAWYEGPGDAGYGLGQLGLFWTGRYVAHGRMPREPRDSGSLDVLEFDKTY